MPRTQNKKSAWLITWEETTSSSKRLEERVIAIFDSRTGSGTIKEFIERFYMADETLSDKVYYSSRRHKYPYRAQYDTAPNGGYLYYSITCGHNPWISARIVKNLRLRVDSEGVEHISFDKIPPPPSDV